MNDCRDCIYCNKAKTSGKMLGDTYCFECLKLKNGCTDCDYVYGLDTIANFGGGCPFFKKNNQISMKI